MTDRLTVDKFEFQRVHFYRILVILVRSLVCHEPVAFGK
jgi:hypothetical protein